MGTLPAVPQLRPMQNVDPLEQYGRALSLKGLMQGQQLQQQQIQENQRALDAKQALDAAYQGSLSQDANGNPTFNRQKIYQTLSANGHGSLIPELDKNFADLDKLHG